MDDNRNLLIMLFDYKIRFNYKVPTAFGYKNRKLNLKPEYHKININILLYYM